MNCGRTVVKCDRTRKMRPEKDRENRYSCMYIDEWEIARGKLSYTP